MMGSHRDWLNRIWSVWDDTREQITSHIIIQSIILITSKHSINITNYMRWHAFDLIYFQTTEWWEVLYSDNAKFIRSDRTLMLKENYIWLSHDFTLMKSIVLAGVPEHYLQVINLLSITNIVNTGIIQFNLVSSCMIWFRAYNLPFIWNTPIWYLFKNIMKLY